MSLVLHLANDITVHELSLLGRDWFGRVIVFSEEELKSFLVVSFCLFSG